jgi:cysteine sulfinate desulfinase/cysteine desulfurase-like protein
LRQGLAGGDTLGHPTGDLSVEGSRGVAPGIYLDHFAGVAIRAEVAELVQQLWQDSYANPSSIHSHGRRALAMADEATQQIAQQIGASPEGIVFTSGASESNNWAISLWLKRLQKTSAKGEALQVVSSRLEHPSVLECFSRKRKALWLEPSLWVEFSPSAGPPTRLPSAVTNPHSGWAGDGLEQLSYQSPSPVLVALSLVNPLVGTVLDLPAVWARLQHPRSLFHCDATAAMGRVPVDFSLLEADSLTFSAHKFGGPHSTGALVVREPKWLKAWIRGGGQQRGLRAGTLDVAGIVATARALELAERERLAESARLLQLRELVWSRVAVACPAARRLSPPEGVPHLLAFEIPNLQGETAVLFLSQQGIFVSSGSACSYAKQNNLPWKGHLRISLGADCDESILDLIGKAMAALSQRFSL